jgi:hypothetical protein
MQVWHLMILAFAAGYAAAIYSWPWIKEQANGAKAEAMALRAKAVALEEKIRSKI